MRLELWRQSKRASPTHIHWHDPPTPACPDATPSRATAIRCVTPTGCSPARPPSGSSPAPARSPSCCAGQPKADTYAHRWHAPAAAAPTASPTTAVPSSVKAALRGRCTRRQGERRCDTESKEGLLEHDNLQFELRGINALRSLKVLTAPISGPRCRHPEVLQALPWRRGSRPSIEASLRPTGAHTTAN